MEMISRKLYSKKNATGIKDVENNYLIHRPL